MTYSTPFPPCPDAPIRFDPPDPRCVDPRDPPAITLESYLQNRQREAKETSRMAHGNYKGHIASFGRKFPGRWKPVRCVTTGEVFASAVFAAVPARCDPSTIRQAIRMGKAFQGKVYEYVEKP